MAMQNECAQNGEMRKTFYFFARQSEVRDRGQPNCIILSRLTLAVLFEDSSTAEFKNAAQHERVFHKYAVTTNLKSMTAPKASVSKLIVGS